MKYFLNVLVLAFSLFIFGCETKGISEAEIKEQLAGRTFWYHYVWGSGGRKWRIHPEGIESIKILNRFTSSDGNSDEVHTLVKFFDNEETIEGILIVKAQKYQQGWKVLSALPEEEDATLGATKDITSFKIERRTQNSGAKRYAQPSGRN